MADEKNQKFLFERKRKKEKGENEKKNNEKYGLSLPFFIH